MQGLTDANSEAVGFPHWLNDAIGFPDVKQQGQQQGQQGQQEQQGQHVDRNLETLGALAKFVGFTKFRPGQQEAFISLLEQRDTVANLPTGSGKSLIYQLLALMSRKAVLVITPTVALVEDQVKNLHMTLKAASTGSAIGASRDILSGDYDVIFMTPEWLWPAQGVSNVSKLAALHTTRAFAAVVVDEAHLVLRWSSFRKGYDQLSQLKEHLPQVPTLLMTATLKKADIISLTEKVGLKQPKVVRVSMTRDNINLQVKPTIPLLKASKIFMCSHSPP